MSEILIGTLVFALAICGLAIGFILNNKPLEGSCGGLSSFEEGAPCEFCGKEQGDCLKTDSQYCLYQLLLEQLLQQSIPYDHRPYQILPYFGA